MDGLKLPIKLKYFSIEEGDNILTKEDDRPVRLYVARNLDTGIVEYEGLILAEVLEKGMAMDRNMHRAADYFGKNLEKQTWLEGCLPDDEPGPGIMVPDYMAGGGGTPPVAH